MFEIKYSDLAGRIGILHSNHGKIETPAYVPVIHPVKQTIPTKKIREMGFDLVITNAYITMKRYGEDAIKRGIHDVIGFDGAIMTDSGGYQVLEYGDVDITILRQVIPQSCHWIEWIRIILMDHIRCWESIIIYI